MHYIMLYTVLLQGFGLQMRPDSPTPDCKGCLKARPPNGGPERVRRVALESG